MVEQTSGLRVSTDINKGERPINLAGILRQAAYIVLSLGLFAGSAFTLVFSFMSGLGTLALTAVVLTGGIGAIVGLFYSAENTKRLFERRPGQLCFGLGDEINLLAHQERLGLVRLADQAYLNQRREHRPSLVSTIGSIFTLRGLTLMVLGALIACRIPHSSDWMMLLGALLALIAPYLISVLYDFFCSYMDRYRFRSEFVKGYLADVHTQEKLEGLSQLAAGARFLDPIKSSWNSFTLQFPVTSGIAAFLLTRAQIVFWSSLVVSAVLPFVGVHIASTSILDPLIQLFGLLGWASGFEHCFRLMPVLDQWNLPHMLGEIITLSIVAYGLGMLSLPNQANTSGVKSLPSVMVSCLCAPVAPVCLPIYPLFWILSLGSLKYGDFDRIVGRNLGRFWGDFFHLWIIWAEIGALLRVGEVLMRHVY